MKPEPEPKQIQAADTASASFGTDLVAIKNPAGAASSIRIQSTTRPCLEADESPAGIAFSTSGRPRQGEDGTRGCCAILAERLRRDDFRVGCPVSPKGPEHGVDWELSTGKGVLHIQVTRPAVGDRWHRLARGKHIQGTHAHVDLVDELLKAGVEKADTTSTSGIVLAIDASDSAIHAMGDMRRFVKARQQEFAGLGFHAVWIVGPVADTTFRADAELDIA